MNKFDFGNIYTRANANVIENLLDRKIVACDEVAFIFSLNIPINTSSKDFFVDSLTVYEDMDDSLINNTVKIDKILPVLIKLGDLPVEVCRLPRLSKEQIGFEVIDDYYDRDLDYIKSTSENIIKHKKNYCVQRPVMLSHSEVLARLTENKLPQSLIKNDTIPLYIEVQNEFVLVDTQVRSASGQSIEYFRQMNCGNPNYTTRYQGLERLTLQDTRDLINGNSIVICDNKFRRNLQVQTTDIETKYHQQRYIKLLKKISHRGNEETINVINFNYVFYMEKDINSLIEVEALKTIKQRHFVEPCTIKVYLSKTENYQTVLYEEQINSTQSNYYYEENLSQKQKHECIKPVVERPSNGKIIESHAEKNKKEIRMYSKKQQRKKPEKHQIFVELVTDFREKGYAGFKSYLEDNNCVFDTESDYLKFIKTGTNLKEKLFNYDTYNESNHVKDVAIIKKANYKSESSKEIFVYRLPREKPDKEIDERRKIPFDTVRGYFTKNS